VSADLQPGEMVLGQVVVYRIADTDGGMRDQVLTSDGGEGELDLPTAVGMLAIAQHTLLCNESGDQP
jgi:hypothetical protein